LYILPRAIIVVHFKVEVTSLWGLKRHYKSFYAKIMKETFFHSYLEFKCMVEKMNFVKIPNFCFKARINTLGGPDIKYKDNHHNWHMHGWSAHDYLINQWQEEL
jgi:hypothetical protein